MRCHEWVTDVHEILITLTLSVAVENRMARTPWLISGLWPFLSRADPWTTWVWTVQDHLWVNFFSIVNATVLQDLRLVESMVWHHGYEGPTINYMRTFNCTEGQRPNPCAVQGVVQPLCCSAPQPLCTSVRILQEYFICVMRFENI